MKLSFRLDTQDYLDYQLYTVSTSEKVMRKRLIGRLLFPIIYLLVGIIFILDKNYSFVAFNLILAVLWYFFYPISERKRYENTFRRSIQHNLTADAEVGRIEWGDNEIYASEKNQEAHVAEKEVIAIVVLKNIILIQLENNHNFILPKVKIEQLKDVIGFLQAKSIKLSIPFIDQSNWQWK